MKIVIRVLVVAVSLCTGVSYSATSWLVSSSPTGLVYTGYANQGQTNAANTIPDFSRAGYQGGGIPIPFIPAGVTLSDDGAADDTTRIQNAINTVSTMPIGPDGFRGAVLLEAGNYTVSSTLTISTSGVVIRGAGSQEIGGTRITYTATTKSNLFEINNREAQPVVEVSGTRVNITDSFVPVGASRFRVANASGYAPGDRIIVQHTVNQEWIDDLLDMSGWDSTDTPWTPDAYQLIHRYVITGVDGNQITINAPLVQALEAAYGGGDIYKYTYSGELENIGFESIRLESTYASDTDENHGWIAIAINRLQNGWVRQVTARYFAFGLVSIDGFCQQITVEDCAMLDHKSDIGGGRRYSFYMDDSQYLLFQRCLAREGRHEFASGSKTPGPNVFVDCRADNSHADSGPHHRYATGHAYDNVMAGQIFVQNRGKSGSGHGWAGAQILIWNSAANQIICDAPNGAMNWCIGSTGTRTEGIQSPDEPPGIWDSQNTPVTPRSLYYTQLAERLGTNALNHVILPQQKAGGIWPDLYSWGGDGLFLDDLLVWADGETVPAVNVPLTIRGTVRNLPMLDRGVNSVWEKVSGPGIVFFADAAELETTATFTETGLYVLKLSVNDGVSTVDSMLSVQVGTGGPDTAPPAAPANLEATPGDGLISLDWDDNTENDLDSYTVYRSLSSGSGYTAVQSGLTTNAYVDSTVTNYTTYYYKVSATDTNENESVQSGYVIAISADLGNQAPSFSSDPVVEINGMEGVAYSSTLADDASDPESDPMIFSKVSGPEWLSVSSAGIVGGTPGATDTGTNRFSVQVNAAGGSDTAELDIVVEVDTVTPPAAPTRLVASIQNGSILLDWDDNGELDLDSYTVYRSTNSGSYGTALATGLASSDYVDSNVVSETTYYYIVTATDIHTNESSASREVMFTPPVISLISLPAAENGAFDGASTQNVSEQLQLRNRYGTGDSDAYLRFMIDAENDTINGVSAADITAVQLNLAVDDTWYEVSVYALDDLANPGTGFLTETSWTKLNLTETIAPHGYVSVEKSSLATSLGSASDTGLTAGDDFTIELDAAKFKHLIMNSSNDEITLIITGSKNVNGYVASLDNTSGYGVPTLEVRAEAILAGYSLWASGWNTDIGAATNDMDGDGLSNLGEYALGGNPTNPAAQGTPPTFKKWGNGFIYVHPMRSDDATITYLVETTTNLISGIWTNQGVVAVGTNVTGGNIDFVTNEVGTVEKDKFLRLKVEQ